MTTATTTTDSGSTDTTGATSAGGQTSSSSSADTAGDDGKDWRAEAEKWKALSRKHETDAKANSKELEGLRSQTMSETEKAVAAARAEGKAEGLALGAAKVAQAELRAAAAGRLSAGQVESLLEVTNLAAFMDEAGEVDRSKLTKLVDSLAPKAPEGDGSGDAGAGTTGGQQTTPPPAFPDLGQGARGGGGNTALNGDPLLRDLKAKLGIR